MNYCSILKADIANGPGFRVSLFVTGCTRGCPGCFNKPAQNPDFGNRFDDSAVEKIFAELDKPWCAGLSLLGGEPMSKCSDNRSKVIDLARRVKEKYPEKTIWMWSGYTFEDLVEDPETKEIFEYIDFIVDGSFQKDKRDLSLKWRGSSNQRCIDVKHWRETGEIIDVR